MTTSTRMEPSIRPLYPHHQSLHPLHMAPDLPPQAPDASKGPLPPLAYLTAAAAAMATPKESDYGHDHKNPSGTGHGQARGHGYGPGLTIITTTTSTIGTSGPGSGSSPSQGPVMNGPGSSSISAATATMTATGTSQFTHQVSVGQPRYHRAVSQPDHPSATPAQSSTTTPTSTSIFPFADTEMKPAPSSAVQDNAQDEQPRRGSLSMDYGSTLSPTPSPHAREHHHHPSHHHQQQYHPNGHHNGHDHPEAHSKQYSNGTSPVQTLSQDHPGHQHPGAHPTPKTPSPPLPSPTEVFQGRPLPPIEPSHPLHTYMSNSRRGSLTEPEYHPSMMASESHRRPSSSAMDTSGYYAGPAPQESRHYPYGSPASTASSSSEQPHYPHPAHPSTSPMQLRQAEHASGRRESLPSIHSSAGPLGQLLAQEPQRRHSIAHSDPMGATGPLKRKTSGTPLSQVHSSSTLDYPAKRRDSIPDNAMSMHPYPPRNSYSAPSSPPRRGSIAAHAAVPTLNLQPAAEIKSSMMPHQNGPPGMDHGRPHFPLHQPRRPSLLSEASQGLSRRSSLADSHHSHLPSHGHPYPGQHPPHPSQDYDHHMGMDLEKMHLSGHGPEPQPGHHHGAPPSNQNPAPGQGPPHLYPGYQSGYPSDGGSQKGDTPYSRSPELRVSHKLAERQRRKEMKDLFDELRDSLPVDRSLKTSKWEILSKAVDYISTMKSNQDELAKEVEMLRQEVARLKKH